MDGKQTTDKAQNSATAISLEPHMDKTDGIKDNNRKTEDLVHPHCAYARWCGLPTSWPMATVSVACHHGGNRYKCCFGSS
ncbi:hypothetical protein DdX_08280 [Ditylenchus destructor]|uniref:Uncharacterized protein n=1 Tax=Ditylenchus destructor TaxID=166010 RepID=A0AAD4N384_9BILA|nr:hypothetical protein DdX_08280 [Ditylenchus destructor]